MFFLPAYEFHARSKLERFKGERSHEAFGCGKLDGEENKFKKLLKNKKEKLRKEGG